LCTPCSAWAGSFWHFSMFCGSYQTSTGWQWNLIFPRLWDFNSYQELKFIIGMFFLSFFLRFIYFCGNLVLWEQGFLRLGFFTGQSLGAGWLTIESHFSWYKIPPHTGTKWEPHLTWLSEMGVTFDFVSQLTLKEWELQWLNAMLCCQQMTHVIFELGFAGGYFDSAKPYIIISTWVWFLICVILLVLILLGTEVFFFFVVVNFCTSVSQNK
jgi:hypothetical protein